MAVDLCFGMHQFRAKTEFLRNGINVLPLFDYPWK
jgi:hypothetical protein